MKIKEFRLKHNLTQSEVAKELGVQISTISQYENNKRQPNSKTLKKLAEIFNCKIDDLV